MTNPISISFVISDNYAQHLAVFAVSVLENNPHSEFVFHVLHRNVSEENKATIKKLEEFYSGRCAVVFHLVTSNDIQDFPIPTSVDHISVESYFRYLLPTVLSNEARTIYSDVDVLCAGDITELWNIDLKGNSIAAVRDKHVDADVKRHNLEIGLSPDAQYYHDGLLVLDLEKMRAEGAVEKLFVATQKAALTPGYAGDMDAYNMVFAGRITEIDEKFNSCDKYNAKRNDVVIWHFPGVVAKPWCNIPKNRSWRLYLKYLKLSPYRNSVFRFLWGRIRGLVYFSYLKNGIRRYLILGIRVYKKKVSNKSYDLVVGLGQNCSTATYMMRNGLRSFSSPFDWIGGENKGDGLDRRIKIIENGFENFMSLSSFVLESDSGEDERFMHYRNLDTAFLWLHDFKREVSIEKVYPSVRAKYERRIGRMYKLAKKAKHLLFIYTSLDSEDFSDKAVNSFLHRLRKQFGDKADLLILKNVKDQYGTSDVKNVCLGATIIKGGFYPSQFDWVGDRKLNNIIYKQIPKSWNLWINFIFYKIRVFLVAFISNIIPNRTARHSIRHIVRHGLGIDGVL